MLESALLDHDVDGPMCDLVQMLLVTVFTLQEEEAEEVEELDKEDQEMSMKYFQYNWLDVMLPFWKVIGIVIFCGH